MKQHWSRFVRVQCCFVFLVLVLGSCSFFSDETPRSATHGDGSLSAIGWLTAPRAEVREGGVLRLAVSAMPPNFNPQHSGNADSELARILAPTNGGAVAYTASGGWRVDHDYARSVSVLGSDPLRVRVKLEPKAVWQDGSPIRAADMVAFWKAQQRADGRYLVASTEGWSDIDSVKSIDRGLGYVVTFKKARADWSRYVYPILPAKISSSPRKFNSGYRRKPVPSNGPFRITKIDTATGTIIQKRNRRWWGPAPRLSQIEWRIAAPQIQVKAFESGELDAVEIEPGGPLPKTGRIARSRGSEWAQLTINASRPRLKDVRVRRAIVKAIDREALAALTTAGTGSPAVQVGSAVLLPGQRGYVDTGRKALKRDVPGAKRLLKKAGWKPSIELTMPVPSDTPTAVARVELIVKQLADVGIKVRTKRVPAAKYFSSEIVPLRFDLVTFTWSGSATPLPTVAARFYPIDSPQNYTGSGPAELGDLLESAAATLDEEEWSTLIAKIDQRIFSNAVIVPFGAYPETSVLRRGVVNFGPATFVKPDFTLAGFAKTPLPTDSHSR